MVYVLLVYLQFSISICIYTFISLYLMVMTPICLTWHNIYDLWTGNSSYYIPICLF